MPPTTKDRPPTLAAVIKKARQGDSCSIRGLARRAGVSAPQVSRIESGGVERPSIDTLVSLSRGLGRNPLPLLIVSGHIRGDEARANLETLYRTDAELVSEMKFRGQGELVERARLRLPEATDDELKSFAAQAFSFPESLETEWHDSYIGALIRGHDVQELRELVALWPHLDRERRAKVLDYAKDQVALSDLDSKSEQSEADNGDA